MRTRDDRTGQDLAALTRLLHDLTGDMPPEHWRRLRDHLVTEVRVAGTGQAPATGGAQITRRRGRPHRRARILLGAAAAAAAIAVTAIGVASHGGPTLPPPSKAAVQLLAKVADAAARQPAPRVGDNQYMYVAERIAYFHPRLPIQAGHFPRHPHLTMATTQTWSPVANVCRTGLERIIPAKGPPSSSTFDVQGSGTRCPSIGGLNDATYRLLQSLPTNPHALLALIYRVERGHGPSPDQEAFTTISDLFNSKIAPPKVTAALYRAAALIPGVTLVPNATDAIGRHGVAVAQTVSGVRSELIFSKTTLRLIGERTVEAGSGATTFATAIIATAFVDHLGQLPPSTPSPAR